jgi:hypothetical protein
MQNSRAKFLVGFIAVSVASLGALVARVAWTERSFVYWQDSVWVVGFAALFWIGYAMACASRADSKQHTFQRVLLEISVPGWLFSLLLGVVPFVAASLLREQFSFQEFALLAFFCVTMWIGGLGLGVSMRRSYPFYRELLESVFSVRVSIMLVKDSS